MRLPFALFLIGFASIFPSVAFAATDDAPTILQMADGRFYNPSSGLIAPTKEGLLVLLSSATTTIAVPVVTSTTPETETIKNNFPLKLAIQKGRALLVERFADEATSTATMVKPAWNDVTLAVWDGKTNGVELMDIQVKGNRVRLDDAGDVVLRTVNGVNSQFAFPGAPEKVVVALRYPIITPFTKRISKRVCMGKKKVSCKTKQVKVAAYIIENVMYTPASPGLRTPEMMAYGRRLFENEVESAYDALKRDGVRSRAFPEELIADVIDPELVKGIMVIEHADHQTLIDHPESTLQTFYALVGANEDRAYAYARSSAKALGIAQFIPQTYARLARRPELHLLPKFEEGMRVPSNAIKAEIAYLDDVLTVMPNEVRASYRTNPAPANAYLAAAYNAGTVRVKKAMAAWGEAWADSRDGHVAELQRRAQTLSKTMTTDKKKLAKEKNSEARRRLKKEIAAAQASLAVIKKEMSRTRSSSLKKETVFYVKKYRALMSYLKPEVAASNSSGTEPSG